MKRNELVKRELSRTLKEMSKSQALSSVTVSALTDKCGFSRGTRTRSFTARRFDLRCRTAFMTICCKRIRRAGIC